MIIVTKDDKQYIPLLLGAIESEEIGEYITCIEAIENPVLNMFQQIEHVRVHISEVKGFLGTYSFPPIVYGNKVSDTADNWKSKNPILSYGQIGIESDCVSFHFKVGNGVLRWNALQYKK